MRLRLICLLTALIAAVASSAALAQWRHGPSGPRVHLGFAFGGPAFYPAPYYYPYYYPPYPAVVYPPAAYAPSVPQTYVERGDAPGEAGQNYWYWCADAKAYYPYVKECPGGWQTVTPRQPPG
jgi:hypothetical protein